MPGIECLLHAWHFSQQCQKQVLLFFPFFQMTTLKPEKFMSTVGFLERTRTFNVQNINQGAHGINTCRRQGKRRRQGLTEGATELLCVCLVAQSCLTLCHTIDCSLPGSSVHGDSPVKNTGVGCHALLQGIFPTEGLNPGLLHCRWILYQLSYQLSLNGNHSPPMGSSEAGMALQRCSLLYPHRGPGLYTPASVIEFVVSDFQFRIISTTPVIKPSQNGEKL